MSLYKELNNEALEDDRKADLEVLRRLKQNYLDNKEKIKPVIPLDKQMILIFKKLYGDIVYEISTTLTELEKDTLKDEEIDAGEYNVNVGDIVSDYNRIVLYLSKMGYNKLLKSEKNMIDDNMNKLVNPLNIIATYLNNDEEKVIPRITGPLVEIIRQINNKLYQPVNLDISERPIVVKKEEEEEEEEPEEEEEEEEEEPEEEPEEADL